MTSDTPIRRPPPDVQLVRAKQLDLFAEFVSNDAEAMSNSVHAWECIPKYFFTPGMTRRLRTASGHADPYTWSYIHNRIEFSCRIQPASIEQEDGTFKACFPGPREELVEEALKRILVVQRHGLHDADQEETWVRFTLSMIQRELKKGGRTRSRPDIKEAIEVMSGCVLTVYREGKKLWRGAILQDLVTVGRDEYLADTKSQHIARMPLFISHSINQLEYRQFNFDRLMRCDGQLTRWIFRQLVNRFRQASLLNTYHFLYSGVVRDSALLQQGRDIDNRRKVREALDQLVANNVLMSYDVDERRAGTKIVDVKYEVRASIDFINEQKAANKRGTDGTKAALAAGLQVGERLQRKL